MPRNKSRLLRKSKLLNPFPPFPTIAFKKNLPKYLSFLLFLAHRASYNNFEIFKLSYKKFLCFKKYNFKIIFVKENPLCPQN